MAEHQRAAADKKELALFLLLAGQIKVRESGLFGKSYLLARVRLSLKA